jgi:hypothetical protein
VKLRPRPGAGLYVGGMACPFNAWFVESAWWFGEWANDNDRAWGYE